MSASPPDPRPAESAPAPVRPDAYSAFWDALDGSPRDATTDNPVPASDPRPPSADAYGQFIDTAGL